MHGIIWVSRNNRSLFVVNNIEASCKAFEAAGVQFLENGQVANGPGVALKK